MSPAPAGADAGDMALPLLAAALIVRNESASLPGCLAALRALQPLVDHVGVHDTGSTDGSQELARAGGATVVESVWADDFAAARNVALAATRAHWVLMVDADERVTADVDALRSALQDAGNAGVGVVKLVNMGAGGDEQYAAPIVRLMRPDRARYAGRVHERPEPLDADRPLELLDLPREVLLLRHYGYADAGAIRRKAERNLDLASLQLEEALQTAPQDDVAVVRALYHRGRTLLSAGRIGEALVDLEHLRALPVPVPERLWGLDVLTQLKLAMGRTDVLPGLVAELRHLGADDRYCDWLEASTWLAVEQFERALPLLRQVDRLVDTVGRDLDITPVVKARMIAAGRTGQVDEATACCIRLMAGLGRAEGLGSLLITLWGRRPADWLADLLAGADEGHLDLVISELSRCGAPGPEVAALLAGSDLPPVEAAGPPAGQGPVTAVEAGVGAAVEATVDAAVDGAVGAGVGAGAGSTQPATSRVAPSS